MKRKYNYEDYHRIINGILEKKCSDCGEWFPCNTEYFYVNKRNFTDGLHPNCKKCNIKRSEKWIKENHERYLENLKKCNARPERKEVVRKAAEQQRKEGYQKQYLQNNKDKNKKYIKTKLEHSTHEITKEEWKNCKEYFNNECAYCGLPITKHYGVCRGKTTLHDFHKEHVIHQGTNDLSNCIPACKSCNSHKWKFEFKEWYRKQEFFNEERFSKIIQWITEDYKKFID